VVVQWRPGVIAGHSRSKNGVTLLAFDPTIHRSSKSDLKEQMDPRVKPAGDGRGLNKTPMAHAAAAVDGATDIAPMD